MVHETGMWHGEVGCAKWPVKQSEEKMRAKIGIRAIGLTYLPIAGG